LGRLGLDAGERAASLADDLVRGRSSWNELNAPTSWSMTRLKQKKKKKKKKKKRIGGGLVLKKEWQHLAGGHRSALQPSAWPGWANGKSRPSLGRPICR